MLINPDANIQTIFAEMYGAVGDGVTDDTVALQTAINVAISTKRRMGVYAGKTYKTTAPLLILSNNGTGFVSLYMQGYPISSSSNYPAIIAPSFTDGPAIAIQGARGVRISGICINGLNNYSASIAGNYNTLITETLYTSGISARDNRYSPYAGIVIDPFSTGITGTDRYPALTSYYTGSLAMSSDIVIEDCIIQYFYVGVIGIGYNGSNTDIVRIISSQINYNKIGVATCHTQMKSWLVGQGSSIYGALTAFDCVTYGNQAGCCPNISASMNIGAVKFIFNITGSGATPSISGIYAESFLSIGYLSSNLGQGSSAISLQGCSFQFYTPTTALSVDIHLAAFKPTKFIGCSINADNVTGAFPLRIYKDSGVNLTFDDCSLQMQYVDAFQVANFIGASDAAVGTRWVDCYIADSLFPSGREVFAADQTLSNPVGQLIPYSARLMLSGSTNEYYNSAIASNITIGNNIAVTVAGQSATFTAPSAAIAAVMRIGDQVWLSNNTNIRNQFGGLTNVNNAPIGVISNIVGTTITCIGCSENFIAGNYNLYIPMFKRLHSSGTASSHSNTTLDAVSNITNWRVGQRIAGDNALGLPSGVYITAINNGTNTITLSQAATATAAGARIYDADIKVLVGTNY